MTETLHIVKLTEREISTILYHLEGDLRDVPDDEIAPEVNSIFDKLENVSYD